MPSSYGQFHYKHSMQGRMTHPSTGRPKEFAGVNSLPTMQSQWPCELKTMSRLHRATY